MFTDKTSNFAATGPQQNFSGYVWLISAVAALGGLLFGYDWVVIGGAKPFFEVYFNIHTAAVSGWANSCALIGCLFGAAAAGALSDRLGRKWLLSSSALLFIITSLGNAMAGTFTVFVAWRILGGVAIGLASGLSPLYIAEVAPRMLRGRLVSLNQLTIVIGVLLAQLVNWYVARNLPAGATRLYLEHSWYGQDGWRWMFALTAIPALLFFLAMFLVPESPRWQIKRGFGSRAKETLTRIGGEHYAINEINEVERTLDGEKKVDWRELFQPRMRKALALGIVLAVLQQWCGINVIFNYAANIFKEAGYDISSVLKNIAFTGSMNLVFTLVALGLVDKGRKPLMLLGSGGLAVIYTALGIAYQAGAHGLPLLLLVLAAIGCYAVSLAPVTWVVISEIFPNRIRGAAVSIAVSALWAASFLLTLSFPALNQHLGFAGTFWLYAAICAVGFVYIFRYLPETKGQSLEQIEAILVAQEPSAAEGQSFSL